MLNDATVNKLREMRLSVMAEALKEQLSDPQFQAMPFEDRLGLMVDREWSARKSNHLKRLIHKAGFAVPGACVEDIEYLPDRKLDRAQIARLASCAYIHERHNVLLLGATGCGKTYLACTLGMAAVRNFLSVKYVRLPDLLVDISVARGAGTYRKLMAEYRKYALLILDEWLLYPLKETEARDLLEIVESPCKVASTIFCSQFDILGWRDKLCDPILADAICDRIVHDSYTVIIHGTESMRKRKGIPEEEAEP